MSLNAWQTLAASGNQSLIAVPPPPTPAQLALPPDQATQALINQQMLNQQAANASQVDTTVGSEIGGAIYEAGSAAGNAAASAANALCPQTMFPGSGVCDWLVVIAGAGVAVFALISILGGRR
jgi:hypothetical protein